MASRQAVKRLEATVRELEEAKKAEKANTPKASDLARFRATLEWSLHPKIVGHLDDDERRTLWPSWELLRLLSSDACFNGVVKQVDYVALFVHCAVIEWWNDLYDAARTEQEPFSLPAWNPINPVTLADMKFRVRLDQPWTVLMGVEHAKQVNHLFPDCPRPWTREFNPSPSSWPAEAVTRVKACESWPPEHVPPFQWSEVPSYSWHHPFPRDKNGNPLPEVLAGERQMPTPHDPLFRITQYPDPLKPAPVIEDNSHLMQ